MICIWKQNLVNFSWKVKVDFIYNRFLIISRFLFCVCSVGNYQIKMKKLSLDT